MVNSVLAFSGINMTEAEQSAGEKTPAAFTTVAKLRPDTRGHSLTVKVVASKLVVNKQGGRGATRIAEVLLGDDTGVIVFSAKNDQVDVLKPGSYAVLHNAKVDMFKGSMRLQVDNWGKVELAEPQPFQAKEDNNLSLVEFELVRLPDTEPATQ